MSSSGCCGRLEGDLVIQRGVPVFAERRRLMERMGELYRLLKREFGDRITLEVIDPRNAPALIPSIVRDALAHRVGFRELLRVLNLGTTSVIINGRIYSSGSVPDGQELVAYIRRLLSTSAQAG